MHRLCLLIVLFAASCSEAVLERNYPDPGYLCPPSSGIRPSIKYYDAGDRMVRYPFLYLGCGGNSNRYDTSDNSIIDYNPCPGFGTDGEVCAVDGKLVQKCREGYKCGYDYPVRRCCSIKDEELYNENLQAKCPQFLKIQLDPEALRLGKHEPFYGRNCSDNFCQEDATCFQGPFLAICCH